MSILPCMKCKHAIGSSTPNLFCDKFHVVVDLRGGCGVGEPIIITNADRIRSMTDEELADVIAEGFCSGRVDKCNNYNRCIDCTLDWLKEEVKDGET